MLPLIIDDSADCGVCIGGGGNGIPRPVAHQRPAQCGRPTQGRVARQEHAVGPADPLGDDVRRGLMVCRPPDLPDDERVPGELTECQPCVFGPSCAVDPNDGDGSAAQSPNSARSSGRLKAPSSQPIS
jgi:hypothetical protein